MVLVCRALLEEETPRGIEGEHGEGAVEPAFGVGPQLLGGAERAVVFVNQHDGVGHSGMDRGSHSENVDDTNIGSTGVLTDQGSPGPITAFKFDRPFGGSWRPGELEGSVNDCPAT